MIRPILPSTRQPAAKAKHARPMRNNDRRDIMNSFDSGRSLTIVSSPARRRKANRSGSLTEAAGATSCSACIAGGEFLVHHRHSAKGRENSVEKLGGRFR